MIRRVFAIMAVISGALSTLWGIGMIVGGNFALGSKFTPEGRDGSTIVLAIVLGLCAVLWGFLESPRKAKRHD